MSKTKKTFCLRLKNIVRNLRQICLFYLDYKGQESDFSACPKMAINLRVVTNIRVGRVRGNELAGLVEMSCQG